MLLLRSLLALKQRNTILGLESIRQKEGRKSLKPMSRVPLKLLFCIPKGSNFHLIKFLFKKKEPGLFYLFIHFLQKFMMKCIREGRGERREVLPKDSAYLSNEVFY